MGRRRKLAEVQKVRLLVLLVLLAATALTAPLASHRYRPVMLHRLLVYHRLSLVNTWGLKKRPYNQVQEVTTLYPQRRLSRRCIHRYTALRSSSSGVP